MKYYIASQKAFFVCGKFARIIDYQNPLPIFISLDELLEYIDVKLVLTISNIKLL
jgi:hypothetical protein